MGHFCYCIDVIQHDEKLTEESIDVTQRRSDVFSRGTHS
jgi:hypothetical protein